MYTFFKEIAKLRPLLTRQDKWRLVFLLGLMFLGSILEALGIGAIPAFVTLITNPSAILKYPWVGKWFSVFSGEPPASLLIWASIALVGFLVFKNIFLTMVFYIQSKIVISQRVKLGDRMFKAYQSAPYEWYLQRNSSELLRNIQNDTAQIVSGVLMPFLNLIMGLTMAGFVMTAMIWNTPGSAFIAIVITGVGIFAVIRFFQACFQRIGKVTRREYEKTIKAIQQGFGAFVDARIIGCENYLNKEHRDSLVRLAKAQLIQFTIHKAIPYSIEIFAILGLLVILFFLIHSMDSLEPILPMISLLGVAMIRLKQLATQIASAVNDMNTARAFIPGIVSDMHELDVIESKNRMREVAAKKIGHFSRLSIDSVTYSYPETDLKAVQGISLELNRGEAIAFVGETGCGKSTLVNLILGLIEPQHGHITVNETDIYQDATGWRNLLGYIQQSIYLIDDTIQANVAFGIPNNEINQEQLWTALRSAGLYEFIMSQPNGLETIVGERGINLSGGQRQRIGIARALYQNPEVLVMDEATSALDNKTEDNVMKAIKNLKKDRTLIMVAHRLSTVKDCDRIYFMRNGRIEDVGKFEELVQASPGFREIARKANI
ncbi:MAG: ABC transporter ATP-binding protein [Desulfosalsimonadaceae bacterium]